MKTLSGIICLLFCVLPTICVITRTSPDLPPPTGTRATNVMDFDAGALIIDMGKMQISDYTILGDKVRNNLDDCASGVTSWYQPAGCVRVNGSSANLFNLYAYGYAVRLLHAGIPLYWSIKANKARDSADFTATTIRVHPTSAPLISTINWGSTTANTSYDFFGGPLIIRKVDAAAALSLLESIKAGYKAKDNIQNGRFHSIVIHKTAKTLSADIRHVLQSKPYVISSAIEGKWEDYGPPPMILWNAGFIEGPIGSGHFKLLTDDRDLSAFNSQTCATLFTEPHIIFDPSGCSSDRCVNVPGYKEPLSNFIKSGGNFLTQCAGVPSYENINWDTQYYPPTNRSQTGNFLTRYGVQGLGNAGNEWTGRVGNDNIAYSNSDLPISQFVGPFSGTQGGTVTAFYLRDLNSATSENSLWADNAYPLTRSGLTTANYNSQVEGTGCTKCCPTSRGTACSVKNTLPSGRNAYIAAGGNILDENQITTGIGGNVYYLGSHSWFSSYTGSTNLASRNSETDSQYNGRRLFLNSVLIPASRPPSCNLGLCPADFECPGRANLGSCQACECRGGKETVFTNATLCDASKCFTCDGTNCVQPTCSSPKTVLNFNTCGCDCPLCPDSSYTQNPSTCVCTAPSSTPSRTKSASVTPSTTQSLSPSRTSTPSLTPSTTKSFSPSSTSAPSVTPSTTKSLSPSRTSSASVTPSTTKSLSPSSTSDPSVTPSTTKSLSPSRTSSASLTPSTTKSLSPSKTSAPSVTPSTTKSFSPSSTSDPSATASTTKSVSPSKSISFSPSTTKSVSSVPSASKTAPPSITPSPSKSESLSSSTSPSGSESPSPVVVVAVPEEEGSTNNIGLGVGLGVGLGGAVALAAAGAGAAAIFVYKKKQAAPTTDATAVSNFANNNMNENPMYVANSATMENPLYATNL